MNIEIILSLLSALCSLIGSLGGILVTSKLNLYRLEQLEKKVDKHNHLVERMYEIEKTVTTATRLYDNWCISSYARCKLGYVRLCKFTSWHFICVNEYCELARSGGLNGLNNERKYYYVNKIKRH